MNPELTQVLSERQKLTVDTLLSFLALCIGSDTLKHEIIHQSIGGINLKIYPSGLSDNYYLFHILKNGSINNALTSADDCIFENISRGFYL